MVVKLSVGTHALSRLCVFLFVYVLSFLLSVLYT